MDIEHGRSEIQGNNFKLLSITDPLSQYELSGLKRFTSKVGWLRWVVFHIVVQQQLQPS